MNALARPIPRIALNRTEVAVAIGVSADSVDTMVDEGVLPRPRRWHTRKIWLVSEIEAFLTELPSDGQPRVKETATDEEEVWVAEL
jgi:predicted DNA-binding transcriptional regulator AlpA